jgi:hypothetical protein
VGCASSVAVSSAAPIIAIHGSRHLIGHWLRGACRPRHRPGSVPSSPSCERPRSIASSPGTKRNYRSRINPSCATLATSTPARV